VELTRALLQHISLYCCILHALHAWRLPPVHVHGGPQHAVAQPEHKAPNVDAAESECVRVCVSLI